MARIVTRLPTTCLTYSTLYTIISSISVSLLLLGVEDASIMYIATRRSLFCVSGLTVTWVLGLSMLCDEVVYGLYFTKLCFCALMLYWSGGNVS